MSAELLIGITIFSTTFSVVAVWGMIQMAKVYASMEAQLKQKQLVETVKLQTDLDAGEPITSEELTILQGHIIQLVEVAYPLGEMPEDRSDDGIKCSVLRAKLTNSNEPVFFIAARVTASGVLMLRQRQDEHLQKLRESIGAAEASSDVEE